MGWQAIDAGLVCRIGYDVLRLSREERMAGKQPSIWAVMAANDGDLGPLADDPLAAPAHASPIPGPGPMIIPTS